jgi:hypothetical protein
MSYSTKVVGQPRCDSEGNIIIKDIANSNSKVIELYCGEDERKKDVKINISVYFGFANDKLKSLKKGDRLLITGKLGTSKSKQGVHGLTITPENNQFHVLDKEVRADYGVTPGIDEGYINGAFPSGSGGHINLLIRRNVYKPYYKKVSSAGQDLFEKKNWHDQSDFTISVGSNSHIMKSIKRLVETSLDIKISGELTKEHLEKIKGYYVSIDINKNPMFGNKEVILENKKTLKSLFINLWAERIDFLFKPKNKEKLTNAPSDSMMEQSKTIEKAETIEEKPLLSTPIQQKQDPIIQSKSVPDKFETVGF